LCLHKILTNNAKDDITNFHCGHANITQKYRFVHRLPFSTVFEKYKIIFQTIFDQSKNHSTLSDFQNVIKRALFVLNHQDVQNLFVNIHPHFKTYFDQPSVIPDTHVSIVSFIDEILTTRGKFDVSHLIAEYAPIYQLGVTSLITSVDTDAATQMEFALTSKDVVATFKYDMMPRFRAIDVVHAQFMSQLKNTTHTVDIATIISGRMLPVSPDFKRTSSNVLSTGHSGGKHIVVKPFPKISF
jgi:hypothetical protein